MNITHIVTRVHLMRDHFYPRTITKFLQENPKTEDHSFIIVHEKSIPNKIKFEEKTISNLSFKIYHFFMPTSPLKRLFSLKTYNSICKVLKNASYIYIHALTNEFVNILYYFKKREEKIIWILWGSDFYNHIPYEKYDPRTKEIIQNLDPSPLINEFSKLSILFAKKYLKSNSIQKIKAEFFVLIYRKILYARRLKVIKKIDVINFTSHKEIEFFRRYCNFSGKLLVGTRYYNTTFFPNMEKIVELDEKYNYKKKFSKMILLGNSGAPYNNHIDMMYQLAKLKIKSYGILCPLSYGGNPEYVCNVIRVGKELFGKKIFFLTEFLDKPTYASIISQQIDVAVWNHNRQQGLGNIGLLLYFKKIIYMKKTPVYFDLIEKGLTIFTLDDLFQKIENGVDIFPVHNLEMNKEYKTSQSSMKNRIDNLNRLYNGNL